MNCFLLATGDLKPSKLTRNLRAGIEPYVVCSAILLGYCSVTALASAVMVRGMYESIAITSSDTDNQSPSPPMTMTVLTPCWLYSALALLMSGVIGSFLINVYIR